MSVVKSAPPRKRAPQQLSVEQVSERIRSAILRGDLKPGAKLTEQDLAAEFEVSRTPIREAIRQLEVERLLTRVPFVGVTVRQLAPEEVLELLEIREVLEEGLVARLATRHMDDAHLRRLQASLRRLTDAAHKGDVSPRCGIRRSARSGARSCVPRPAPGADPCRAGPWRPGRRAPAPP